MKKLEKRINLELHNEILEIHKKVRKDIDKAIKGYKKSWEKSEKEVFSEIAFCILTPQSKAKNAWSAITKLVENNLLYTGTADELVDYLNVVRFKNNKAKYLIELRDLMTRDGKSYKSLEEMGIVMPVKSLNIEYINSVKYDDMISIQIEIKELTSVKVIFEYTIFDQEGVLKAKANTTNVFTNKSGKIEKITNEILEKLKNTI